ncbi:hypothetical protein ACLOJK_029033 [Asimina triloba]
MGNLLGFIAAHLIRHTVPEVGVGTARGSGGHDFAGRWLLHAVDESMRMAIETRELDFPPALMGEISPARQRRRDGFSINGYSPDLTRTASDGGLPVPDRSSEIADGRRSCRGWTDDDDPVWRWPEIGRNGEGVPLDGFDRPMDGRRRRYSLRR